jgi:hypothetical protein
MLNSTHLAKILFNQNEIRTFTTTSQIAPALRVLDHTVANLPPCADLEENGFLLPIVATYRSIPPKGSLPPEW